MIFCNLKVLLAQKNISISKMSSETGISRTTLTALSSNKSGGIQFDTMNTICSYLNILPNDLIIFSQYDVSFEPLSGAYYDTLIATVVNLLSGIKVSFELHIDKSQGDNYLGFICDPAQKDEFFNIIKSLPSYYLFYLNNQIKTWYEHFNGVSNFNLETHIR